MTTPEHVETFVSIVVGLALADMAHSLHRLLRAGRRVRWDLLTPLAALLVTASVVNTWWTTDLVFSKTVTFAAFLPNLGSLILLFLLWIAALSLNEIVASAALGRSAGEIVPSVGGNLVFLPVFALLMWTKRRWIHGLALAFCLLVVVGSWAFDTTGNVRFGGEGPAARAAGAPAPPR